MLYREPAQPGGAATDVDPPPSARRTFQRLRMMGLSTSEAGNLTAHLTGLRVAGQAWTVSEIERLMFLRTLVETGRLSS